MVNCKEFSNRVQYSMRSAMKRSKANLSQCAKEGKTIWAV